MIQIKISHMNQGKFVNQSWFIGVDVILGMILLIYIISNKWMITDF